VPGHGTARPKLSLPAVLRGAAAAYHQHWRVLLLTAVALFVPIGLLEALAEGFREVDSDSGAVVAEAVTVLFVAGVAATVGDVFYTGVVAAAVSAHRLGLRHELSEVARHLPYLTLLAVDVLFALAVAAGLVLLVIPGVVAFTWFALAPAAVEIEGRGVRDAFRRSRELVRGNFWRVLALLAPVVIVGEALGELLGSSGPWLLGETFAGDWLGTAVVDIATAPLYALAAVTAAHHLGATPRPSPSASPRTRPPSSRRSGPAPTP
jgi:hypothetical protein